MRSLLITAVVTLLLTACQYEAPITTDHSIPVDPHVLGAWKILPAENQDNNTSILIFRFSDTEYALRYHEDSGDLYFRAYGINVGGIPAIQLEWIGSDEKAVSLTEKDRYHVVSYRIDNDILEIRSLNSELVSDELPDSESLRKAMIENRENPALFNEPGFFKRVKD